MPELEIKGKMNVDDIIKSTNDVRKAVDGISKSVSDAQKSTESVIQSQVSDWKKLQAQIEANEKTIQGYEKVSKSLKDAGYDTKVIQEQIDGLKQANEILAEMQGNIGNIDLSKIFDKSDIVGTADRLRDHIQNITDSVEGVNLPSKLQSIADKLEMLSVKSAKMQEVMDNSARVPTEAYAELEAKLARLQEKMGHTQDFIRI